MRTAAVITLIAIGSSLFAGGPSADQMAGLVKAASAIADGATITTKIGGSTVTVTRQNGVATCMVDGKPIALRVPGPAPKVAGLTTMTDTIVQQVGTTSTAASAHPLFLNNLLWVGTPNPNPPANTVFQFTPIALVPGFLKPVYGWFDINDQQAQVIGKVFAAGPYGTVTYSVGGF
jgi:hypothetical protein